MTLQSAAAFHPAHFLGIMAKRGKLRGSKYGGSAGVKVRFSQGYHQRVAQVNHTLCSAARRREETERKHRAELAGMPSYVRFLATNVFQPSPLLNATPSTGWQSMMTLGKTKPHLSCHSARKACSSALLGVNTRSGKSSSRTRNGMSQ